MRAASGFVRSSALALVTLVAPAAASANGRFPVAQHVLVGPGRESRTIALRTTFGFAISDDGGRTFRWICEEALQYAGPVFDPAFALDADSRLHVGSFNGYVRTSADRCGFDRLPAFGMEFVADLDHSPTGETVAAVTSSGGTGARNRVFRSDDRGETFRPMGEGLADVLFETLEMAPSDTRRVYLTAVAVAPRRTVFYRSDDGGATLVERPLPVLDGLSGAYIAGVDPSNPDVVFVRAPLASSDLDAGSAGASGGATALLRTTDGGASWREVARTRGAMFGFALSDDGRTVWIGGPDAGDRLQRSDDGGDTFRRVADTQVLCLRQHAGVLYVCANYVVDGFALGRSTDRGATITPLLSFGEIAGPVVCDRPSPVTTLCGARWPLVYASLPREARMRDGGVAMDARGAAEMAPPPPPSGCQCRSTPARGGVARGWAVLLSVLLVLVSAARRARVTHNAGGVGPEQRSRHNTRGPVRAAAADVTAVVD